MRSIRTKLTVIIIATSVLAVAMVGVSARWITHSQFNTFRLEQTRSAFIDAATVYYQQHGSWAGAEVGLEEEISRILGIPRTANPNGYVPQPRATDRAPAEAALPAPPEPPTGAPAAAPTAAEVVKPAPPAPPTGAPSASPTVTGAPAPEPGAVHPLDRFERRNPFALISVAGVTVIGNHRWHRGDAVPNRVIANGTPVVLDGSRIGTVTYDQPPELRTLERIYLRRTGQALFYAAIAAFALALAVGILATRFFTRPIRDLTGAIRKMRAGDLEQSVPVFSNDEFGEMALAFNDMSAQVARSQRLREQMTADIAHDLRTPLSVLTGYLESIRDGVLEASPETVDTMFTEATLLQRLVEDLRTLSMADAGRLSLQREIVDTNELLHSARQSFGPLAEQAGVHVELQVEEPAPLIDVDPNRMRQVFANLIGNALHHTSRGGRVLLGARREDGDVVLSVEDDGRGIAPEALPHIFERFYRGDAARSEPGIGSGLGLPIARSLVVAHGGTIDAASELHRGTTITIRLPEVAP